MFMVRVLFCMWRLWKGSSTLTTSWRTWWHWSGMTTTMQQPYDFIVQWSPFVYISPLLSGLNETKPTINLQMSWSYSWEIISIDSIQSVMNRSKLYNIFPCCNTNTILSRGWLRVSLKLPWLFCFFILLRLVEEFKKPFWQEVLSSAALIDDCLSYGLLCFIQKFRLFSLSLKPGHRTSPDTIFTKQYILIPIGEVGLDLPKTGSSPSTTCWLTALKKSEENKRKTGRAN